jgi:phage shock protein C
VAASAPTPRGPLVRPLVGRQIAGVCIGMAQANGWDVTTIRILTVLAAFCTGGLVAVAYLAAWLGIPEDRYGAPGIYPPQNS